MSNRGLIVNVLKSATRYLTIDEITAEFNGKLTRKQVGNAISQMKNIGRVAKNDAKKWTYGIIEDEDTQPESPKLNTLKQILGPIAELEADKQKAINTLVKLNKIISTTLEELNHG